MLVADNISKTYRVKKKLGLRSQYEEKTAVRNINIEVDRGQIVGLLGVNGAGKTTTIKMLSTILEPTSGTIQYDGIDAQDKYSNIRSKINMIMGGERNLYWRLTGKENLEYFGSLYRCEKKLLNRRIEELLSLVQLDDAKNIPVERYSKGMKQRLQIARGLINDPTYIFLDEPTIGLDISIACEMRRYIKKMSIELNKGLLLTTHNIREAEELCDYIYVIDKGKIILEGTNEMIKKTVESDISIQMKVNESVVQLEEMIRNKLGNQISISDSNIHDNYLNIKLPKNHIDVLIDTVIREKFSIREMQTKEEDLESVLLKIIERTQ